MRVAEEPLRSRILLEDTVCLLLVDDPVSAALLSIK